MREAFVSNSKKFDNLEETKNSDLQNDLNVLTQNDPSIERSVIDSTYTAYSNQIEDTELKNIS